MFTTADKLVTPRADGSAARGGVHIIGRVPGEAAPVLLGAAWDGAGTAAAGEGGGTGVAAGGVKVVRLDLSRHRFALGSAVTCTGLYDGETHRPCPHKARLTRGSLCDDCMREIIGDPECLFNPKCEGSGTCSRPLCAEPHRVYIAFFGTTPKVGMTASRRIMAREQEQGADAFLVVGEYPTRLAARNVEKRISRELAVTERISSKRFLMTLASATDADIESAASALSSRIATLTGKSPEPLIRLESRGISLPLSNVPTLAPVAGIHGGESIGHKGRFFIYRRGILQALDMQAAVGRVLRVVG
jgi:hypothetical protein